MKTEKEEKILDVNNGLVNLSDLPKDDTTLILDICERIEPGQFKIRTLALSGHGTNALASWSSSDEAKRYYIPWLRIDEHITKGREVGTSYFDAVSNTISSGKSSTTAMKDSTETEQF